MCPFYTLGYLLFSSPSTLSASSAVEDELVVRQKSKMLVCPASFGIAFLLGLKMVRFLGSCAGVIFPDVFVAVPRDPQPSLFICTASAPALSIVAVLLSLAFLTYLRHLSAIA